MALPELEQIIICSGFFQDAIAGDTPWYGKVKTFADYIVDAKCKVPIKFIAGKFDDTSTWDAEQDYRNFYGLLKQRQEITCSAYLVREKNWHAKIALAMRESRPVAAIIGSSNMTYPAYMEGTFLKKWNYECDVIITNNAMHSAYTEAVSNAKVKGDFFLAGRLDHDFHNIEDEEEDKKLQELYSLIPPDTELEEIVVTADEEHIEDDLI